MPTTHDPYRNTIKRSLDEKNVQKRKKEYAQHHQNAPVKKESKAFLDQSVELPESVNNALGLSIFALVPYMIGITFIFLIIAQANIETYRKSDMHSFLLAWTIGYEFIAGMLLLVILKSAFTFKNK